VGVACQVRGTLSHGTCTLARRAEREHTQAAALRGKLALGILLGVLHEQSQRMLGVVIAEAS
jgi:hypothetical protein